MYRLDTQCYNIQCTRLPSYPPLAKGLQNAVADIHNSVQLQYHIFGILIKFDNVARFGELPISRMSYNVKLVQGVLIS